MLEPEHIKNRIEAAFRPGPATVVFREADETLEVGVCAMTGGLLFPEIQVSRLREPADLDHLIRRMRSALLRNT